MKTGHLTVVSCGLGPGDIGEAHRRAVAEAAVLAGGERLLAWFPAFKGEKVVIEAHARDTADALAKRSEKEKIAVLASGDGLFFGIARLFVARVPAERLAQGLALFVLGLVKKVWVAAQLAPVAAAGFALAQPGAAAAWPAGCPAPASPRTRTADRTGRVPGPRCR